MISLPTPGQLKTLSVTTAKARVDGGGATLAAGAARHRILVAVHDPRQVAWAQWRGLIALPAQQPSEFSSMLTEYLAPAGGPLRNYSAQFGAIRRNAL